MKYVFSTNVLEPGMVMGEDVIDEKTGVLLLAKGVKLTEMYINRLKRRNINYVSIDLSKEQKKKFELDHDVIPTVDSKTMCQAVEVAKDLESNPDSQEMTVKKAIEVAQNITSKICNDSELSYRLNDYKTGRDISEHEARVAMFAVAVANKYNERIKNEVDGNNYQINLEEIAVAALIHDVGRACEDDDIRKRLNNLTYLESKFIGLANGKVDELKENYDEKFIPYYGFNLIKDNCSLTSGEKIMVLLSGENEIGEGPLKARQSLRESNSKEQHVVGSKIINFCSIYDELLLDNIKNGVSLENAYSAMQEELINKKVDARIFDDFIQAVPLYPEGTKVMLHGEKDGYAIVKENFGHRTYYSRPVLISVPNNEIIDLREDNRTTVKQIVGDEIKMSELYAKKLVQNESNKNKDDKMVR